MKNPPFLAGGLLLLPLLLAAAPAYELEKNVDIHPLIIKEKLILVKAEINDRSGWFLLDTGVGHLILNSRHFSRENFPSTTEVTDVNGVRQTAAQVAVRSFRWGSLFRLRFVTQAIDCREMERLLGQELLGLIGYDVIKDLEMAIDYDRRRLTLYRLDAEGKPLVVTPQNPDHRLAFELERHLPALDLYVDGCRPLRVGFDSGSAINLLDNVWKNKLEPAALRRYRITYSAALSERRVDYYTLPEVKVENELALIYCKVAFSSMQHMQNNEVRINGILGVDLFRLGRVTLNYRRREICIWVNDNAFAMKYQAVPAAP